MKKIGLVLAGGGGKGAFHIGVWKALRETGLDAWVAAVSGTSVGGLNAALFLQGDYEKAEAIWENISYNKILTPKGGQGSGYHNPAYQEREYNKKPHLFRRDGLLEIIDRYLDMEVFQKSSRNCYLTCVPAGGGKAKDSYLETMPYGDGSRQPLRYVDGKATYFNMRGYSPEDVRGILLASSAIPFIFPEEKIGENYYKDGGLVDNLPIEPLYELEKCEVIVTVHVDQNHGYVDKGRFPKARILEIRPKKEQGGCLGVLDFDAGHAKRRIQEGYEESIGVFWEIRKIYLQEKGARDHLREAAAREAVEMQRIRENRRIIQQLAIEQEDTEEDGIW